MKGHWRLKGNDGWEKIQVEDSLQGGQGGLGLWPWRVIGG